MRCGSRTAGCRCSRRTSRPRCCRSRRTSWRHRREARPRDSRGSRGRNSKPSMQDPSTEHFPISAGSTAWATCEAAARALAAETSARRDRDSMHHGAHRALGMAVVSRAREPDSGLSSSATSWRGVVGHDDPLSVDRQDPPRVRAGIPAVARVRSWSAAAAALYREIIGPISAPARGARRVERRFETLWPLPMLADHYLLELERE